MNNKKPLFECIGENSFKIASPQPMGMMGESDPEATATPPGTRQDASDGNQEAEIGKKILTLCQTVRSQGSTIGTSGVVALGEIQTLAQELIQMHGGK